MSALAAFAVAVLLFAVCGWYLSRSKHALEEWPLTEGRVRTQVKSYPAGKTAKPSKPPPAPGIPGYWFPATVLISDERNRQIEKWGVQDHPPMAWLAILTEEVGELAQAMAEEHWRNGPREDVLTEAVQVAAVAQQIVEAVIDGRCKRVPVAREGG